MEFKIVEKRDKDRFVLKDLTNGANAKCKYKNSTCSSPCIFGANQYNRKI